MFVQISNSRLRKKKATEQGIDSSDNDNSMKEEEEKTQKKEEFAEVDLENPSQTPGEDDVVIKGVNKDKDFMGKISEKAAKLRKTSLGKLFGEKENSDVRIYTIDREMKRSPPATEMIETRRHRIAPVPNEPPVSTKFVNSELTDRLQQTRQPAFYDVGGRLKTVGIQAESFPGYRLYFLPHSEWNDPDNKTESCLRLVLSQAFLLIFLLVWIIFGALLFYLVEGSQEYNEIGFLGESENNLRISLSSDLLQIVANSQDTLAETVGNGTTWLSLINEYFVKEKHLINDMHRMGYSLEGEIWTYAGSILFAVSLITTLGYGFPLPSSAGGCVSGVIFTVVGLPINFYFLKSCGRTLAVFIQLQAKDLDFRLQALKKRIQNMRKYGEARDEKPSWPEGIFEGEFRPPWWLPGFAPIILLLYYLIGSLIFGPIRGRLSAYSVLLFPCDISVNLAEAGEFTRLTYALYLEVGALLVSTVISLFHIPAPDSLIVDPLISINVLTNTLD